MKEMSTVEMTNQEEKKDQMIGEDYSNHDEEMDGLLMTRNRSRGHGDDDDSDYSSSPTRQCRRQNKNSQTTRKERIIRLLLTVLIIVLMIVTLVVFASFAFSNDTNRKSKVGKDATTSGTSTTKSTSTIFSPPPVARREEDRVFYAGVLLPSSSTNQQQQQLARQDSHSQHPLMDPPKAVSDPYGWLRDETRQNTEVLQHLQAENDYTYNVTHTAPFLRTKDSIFSDMKSMMRLEESSYTFPVVDRDYYYYKRTFRGLSYPVHCRAPVVDETNAEDDDDNVSNQRKKRSHGLYLQYHLQQWEKQEWNDGTPTSTSMTTSPPVLPGEVIYLDENTLANEHEFFNIGAIKVSPSQEYVAYTVDTTGDEQYYVVVQHISTTFIQSTGADPYSNTNDDDQQQQSFYWEDTSVVISEDLLWGNDDSTLFYLKMDDTQRTNSVYRRRIPMIRPAKTNDAVNDIDTTAQEKEEDNVVDNGDDELLLFEEPDVLYWVGFGKTTDQQYLLVMIASSESSEVRYLDLFSSSWMDEKYNDDNLRLKVVAGRRPNVLYDVDHRRGVWWMTSTVGDDVSEYQLWVGNVEEHSWKRVLDPNDPNSGTPLLDGVSISDLTAFDRHLVVQGREGGMVRIWIITFDDDDEDVDDDDDGVGSAGSGNTIRDCNRWEWGITEPAHSVELGANMDFYASTIIVEYESLVTPLRYMEVDLHPEPTKTTTTTSQPFDEHRLVIIMETKVPGYDRDMYTCDRINVLSRDGITQIPVSIVYRKDVMEKTINGQPAPLHLYAYGAYGDSIEDWLSTSNIALLNHGFIYAVAHVRGGGELGRAWYEDGKYLKKTNTFDDVVDVGRYFVDIVKWTNRNLMSCEGRSAGGLTMQSSKTPGCFVVLFWVYPLLM
jgi:oligopeptidase B